MGQPLPSLDVPLVKGINGVLALTESEIEPGTYRPCIRCAACVNACPCGLRPLEMAKLIRAEKLDAASEIGLHDCISCGACSWVCPSYIPLVQYFNYGKGRLMEIREEAHMAAELKRLAEERDARVARQEAEKRAKAEARKKAIAARKAAAAKKEAEKATAAAGGRDGGSGAGSGGDGGGVMEKVKAETGAGTKAKPEAPAGNNEGGKGGAG